MRVVLQIEAGMDRVILTPETESDRDILGRFHGQEANVNVITEWISDGYGYSRGKTRLTEVRLELRPPVPDAEPQPPDTP